MNPLIQGKSGATPVMSRNAFSTNQGTNEDDSQSDPHPEAGIFGNQTMRSSGQKNRRDSQLCGISTSMYTTEKVVKKTTTPTWAPLVLPTLNTSDLAKE